MKIFEPLCIVLCLSLIACNSGKQEQTSQEKVALLVESWVKTINDGNTDSLSTYYASKENIAPVFTTDNDVTITVDKIDVIQDPDGNYVASFNFQVSMPDSNVPLAGNHELIFRPEADGTTFKIIETSTDLPMAVIKIINDTRPPRQFTAEQLALESMAKTLRKTYDSVIYYTKVDTTLLFYVINGTGWEYNTDEEEVKKKIARYKMGVVTKDNHVIVPVEFDKVYSPNGTVDHFIEAQRQGKKGLYSLTGHELLKPEFDAIYPVTNGQYLAQVKKDGLFGWVTPNGEVIMETSPEASLANISESVKNWKFNYPGSIAVMQYPYTTGGGDYDYLCNGMGVFVTPSYLYETGLIPVEYRNVYQGDDGFGLESNSVKTAETKTFFGKLLGIFTLFDEAGVHARDYHYDRTDLIIVNEKLDTVSRLKGFITNSERYGSGISPYPNDRYRQVDSTLFEVAFDSYTMYPLYDEILKYKYFHVTDAGKIEELTTTREFACTKFVKMTEAYFQTTAIRHIQSEYGESGDPNLLVYHELSVEDLDIMRNEIFAEYGMIFKSEKWKKYFEGNKWYKPQYDNVDKFLTEIDRHNINLILEHKKKILTKKIVPDSVAFYEAG